MRPRHLLAVSAALIAVVGLAGCAANEVTTSVVSASASPTQQAVPLSVNDVMFLQMMVPHHAQALDMADMVKFRTDNTDVRDLADQIGAAQDPEISLMKGWLTEQGLPTEAFGMESMMTGMLPPDQMNALTAARGAQFDQLWLEGMRTHHEGAVQMANDVLVTTSNPQVKALAEEIVASQSAEVADIDRLLGN